MSQQDKERVESYVLRIAREIGVPIPSAEDNKEGPGFRFYSETPMAG